VEVDLKITHINYLDEWNEKVELETQFRVSWDDERLSWTSSHYNDISKLTFSSSEVWSPDLFLLNSADMKNSLLFGSSNVVVTSRGEVTLTTHMSLTPVCPVDISNYPYDVQTCSVRLGSRMQDDGRLELHYPSSRNSTIVSSDYVESSEWEVVGQSVESAIASRPWSEEPFTELLFSLQMKRHSAYYGSTLVTPCAVALTLIMAVFWFPPDCGERIIIACSTALLMLAQLLYLSYRLPPMRSGVPTIAFLTSKLMLQVTVGALLSAVGITSISVPIRNPPYRLVRWFIRTRVTSLVCVTRPPRHKVNGTSHVSNTINDMDAEERKMAQNREEWIACLVICDRLNFLGLCLSYGGLILYLLL